MSTDHKFPNRYAFPPTPDERRALQKRRAKARETPLERGDTLEWVGPSRYDDVLPAVSAVPTVREDHRPAHDVLLSASGPARSDEPHSLKLVEPLQTGVAWSQVWHCQARGPSLSAEQPSCDVVVKFFDEALFPYPEGELVSADVDMWDWWAADTLEERERNAYAALRSLQSTVLPSCYGFYSFQLPRGETIIGVVLEDLTEIARPLLEHVKRTKGLYTRNFAAADGMIRALFGGIRQMHNLEMAEFDFQPSDIFVLKSSAATAPKLVFIDFDTTRSRSFTEAAIKISAADMLIRTEGRSAAYGLAHWRHGDEYWAAHMGREQVSSDMWTWWELWENKHETLGLSYQSTSKD